MADAANDGPNTPVTLGGVTPSDAKFLIECLKNSRGPVSVDVEKVASAMGLTNPKSVSNRLGQLKKKYGMEFTTSGASGAKTATDVAGSPLAAGKVRKPRTPRTPKTPKTPKTARVAKNDPETPTRKGKDEAEKSEEKDEEEDVVDKDEEDSTAKAQDRTGDTTDNDEDGPATGPSEVVTS
ncbi:MAG: hypothetical protein M1815_005218 [Lichina confinis]|nr:MAG: hypothetical protein M1815_005218 [Lichina confinis]